MAEKKLVVEVTSCNVKKLDLKVAGKGRICLSVNRLQWRREC